MSTITMCPWTLAEMRAKWSADPRAMEALSRFSDEIVEPGARLWVYGWPECYPATTKGLSVDLVEMLFGGTDQARREFCPPLLAAARDDTGELFQVGPQAAALRSDADRAWHVLDHDGYMLAGGPPIYEKDRALAIAARYGDGCTVRLGVPSSGSDWHPDDGLGFFDPEVAARYETWPSPAATAG